MGRALRIEFAGAFYHVTARGNERKPIYRDALDRQRFLNLLADIGDRLNLLLHAYVLMTNHYHLLVETLEANLQKAMHALNGNHAKQFNRAHRRVGHLFQQRYKAILVDRDSYLVELSRYIHLNPVRAGIVEHADEYPWSSAPAYVGRRRAPALLTIADVLGHFGPTPAQAQRHYRTFLRDGENRRLDCPWRNVTAGTLLGDAAWVERIRRRLDQQLGAERHAVDWTEVPALSQLRVRPTLDAVLARVEAAMDVDRRIICARHSRSQARPLAMYLACRLTALPQREIGATFGVDRFAVSKATALIEAEVMQNPTFAEWVKGLRAGLLSPPA